MLSRPRPPRLSKLPQGEWQLCPNCNKPCVFSDLRTRLCQGCYADEMRAQPEAPPDGG